jgi:hypothetical protein
VPADRGAADRAVDRGLEPDEVLAAPPSARSDAPECASVCRGTLDRRVARESAGGGRRPSVDRAGGTRRSAALIDADPASSQSED